VNTLQAEQLQKQKAKEAALLHHRTESEKKMQKFGLSQEAYDEIRRHEVTPPFYLDEKGNRVVLCNMSADELKAMSIAKCVQDVITKPLESRERSIALKKEAENKRKMEKMAIEKASKKPKLSSVTNTRKGLCITGDTTLTGLLAVKEGIAATEAEAAAARDSKATGDAAQTAKVLKEAQRKCSRKLKLNTAEKTAVVIAYRKFRGADKKCIAELRKSMKYMADATTVFDRTSLELTDGVWPWAAMGIFPDNAFEEDNDLAVEVPPQEADHVDELTWPEGEREGFFELFDGIDEMCFEGEGALFDF